MSITIQGVEYPVYHHPGGTVAGTLCSEPGPLMDAADAEGVGITWMPCDKCVELDGDLAFKGLADLFDPREEVRGEVR